MATQTQPTPIELTPQGRVKVADLVTKDKSDNERALATVERLMRRARRPEEDALLQVLRVEIESFESMKYSRPEVTPEELLRFLLEENDLAA